MSNQYDRISNKSIYGPLSQKTLKSALKRELMTNFGFENMGIIADTLIERFLKIIDEYSVDKECMLPYQTILIAVDRNQKLGRGKTMSMVKLKPTIVNIITHKELLELARGRSLIELRPQIVARIFKEIYEQGGVGSLSDVGMITGLSGGAISKAIKEYYKTHPDEILPHSGTIFDIGTTLTHKRRVIELYLRGLLTQEISRRTSHDPSNVDEYINKFERVYELYKDNEPISKICFVTGISQSCVKEYIRLIEQLKEEEIIKEDK